MAIEIKDWVNAPRELALDDLFETMVKAEEHGWRYAIIYVEGLPAIVWYTTDKLFVVRAAGETEEVKVAFLKALDDAETH